MPYPKEHKLNSRNKILQSAFSLFSRNGFDNVTVNQVMENCKLTRGAFYAHFKSKAQLYTDALKFSAKTSRLADKKDISLTDKQWLNTLLFEYLSIEHVKGTRACPLAFLTTDIVTRDPETKQAYASAFKAMNDKIIQYTKSYAQCSQAEILSVTAMMIGAVAIARTMDKPEAATQLLEACLEDAKYKLKLC